MNNLTTARKYRPSLFRNIVGQSNIITVLKNTIRNNHINHSYLFCGPRGVGKTTCARVLAKAINCSNLTEDIEPCNKCISCTQNNAFNIYELDAASNNSVEDIRNLVDQIRYQPQSGKYKVYIIDEVHMLSNAAFNAFLKTLEEPPSYVVFILATTERHKVIPTILSRCQIFEFKRITQQEISKQLENIANNENIGYDVEALQIISQKSDGSLRDALSMFDLISAFDAYKKVSYEATVSNLHILDYNYYFNITDAIIEKNVPRALTIYDEILNLGFDDYNFIIGLSEHFRNLIVCKSDITTPLLRATDNFKQRYIKQATYLSEDYLFEILNETNKCSLSYGNSLNTRLHVEISLINMVNNNQDDKDNELTRNKDIISKPSPSITIKEKEKVSYKAPDHNTIKIPSITELMDEASNVNKIEDANNSEVNTSNQLNKETIKQYWEEYVGSERIANNLTPHLVTPNEIIINNDTIMLKVDSAVKKGFINGIQQNILDFLRTKCNNPNIRLQIELEITKQANNKPITNNDKLNYITNKYPNVLLLQQKLYLESD